MKTAATAFALLLALMYIPPYTILKQAPPLTLYAYWLALSLASLALAALVLRRRTMLEEG